MTTESQNTSPDDPRNDSPQTPRRKGQAWLIIGIALALLLGASFVPWESITGGRVKNFNIIGDILSDSVLNHMDSVAAGKAVAQPDELIADDALIPIEADDDAVTLRNDTVLPERKDTRVNDMVVIEDYYPNGKGLAKISEKLAAGRPVRIAVVGDSYIEGDIMTQDLRSLMQKHYGGQGVGYMNMHSEFPGFRRSVIQGGDGWKLFSATKRGSERYTGLSEEYAQVAGSTATATYKGIASPGPCAQWTSNKVLFVAPQGGSVLTRVNDNDWITHTLDASSEVQCISVDSLTTEFDVRSSDRSIAFLGVYLDEKDHGVAVDCMSARGISGYSLANVDSALCGQMSRFINYDLIILEFGINVLSPKQSNYNVFSRNMVKVIRHLHKCYPQAQFLLLGVGDRGEKRNGQVRSMTNIDNIIEAQRKAAMEAGIMFWDMREAMGGADAIVDWSKSGRANKDYIHLTHKGGSELAGLLFNAIQRQISPTTPDR